MTSDNVRLHAALHDSAEPTGLAVVVAHGVTHHVGLPTVERLLRRLALKHSVLGFDLRGHGRSGGVSTVGDAEIHDVEAAVRYARERYERVATLGISLGASVVLRHAALVEAPDAVAVVSCPARWWVRETPAMRRVHWMLEQPQGRIAARLLGVRLGTPWAEIPASPVEVASLVPPEKLLIVHGERDQYFPREHAEALHRATGGEAELWLEPGMRHAESALTPQLVDRIARWLDERTRGNAVGVRDVPLSVPRPSSGGPGQGLDGEPT
ncbi:alpha/beta hydrolase [Allokutzneria sp. NRRL B-24872]|uniref:alpha/beta hydrolase n=1 Tax=Allokutzneria sp. NRRL B-24872 TaxID=1137961 RepID=UPI000A3911F5|nr:alpha/beta fold hydrolase [Allokutzneria sp. NRRL B-24872]